MTDFRVANKGKNISYPKISNSDNIFVWFGENHAGYSKKNDGTMCPTIMPNPRKQMVYVEYMELMFLELKPTGFTSDSNGGNYKPSNENLRGYSYGSGNSYGKGNSHNQGNYNGRGKDY